MAEGLYPTDIDEAYQVEAIGDFMADDYLSKVITMPCIKAKDKAAWYKENLTEHLPKLFGHIEKLIGKNVEKTGFAVGKTCTMADIDLLSFFSFTILKADRREHFKPIIAKYPGIEKFIANMEKKYPEVFATFEKYY